MFASKRYRRFLMHLIGHHVQVNLRNSYIAGKSIPNENGGDTQRKLYSQVGVMLGYFKHSCSPNVYVVDRDGDTVYIAIRPIKAGEHLFMSFCSFHWDKTIEWFTKLNGIDCKCERCERQLPSGVQMHELSIDPDFQFVDSNKITSEIQEVDGKIFEILTQKCVKLLKKYGRMHWCYRLGVVIITYSLLLQAKVRGVIRQT